MNTYLLIQSKSPWESSEHTQLFTLAKDLVAAGGNLVSIFLVQNGVLGVRKGVQAGNLEELATTIPVLADDFSLRERSIGVGELVPGIKPTSIDTVVDMLAAGAKVIWY